MLLREAAIPGLPSVPNPPANEGPGTVFDLERQMLILARHAAAPHASLLSGLVANGLILR